MRKLLALAAVVGTALVVAVAPASTAKIDDINGGPVCADITHNSGIFDYSNGTVTFVLGTVAPSCRGITYTVSAYSDVSGTFLGTGSAAGNKAPGDEGAGFVVVTVPIDQSAVEANPQSFCIVATSSDDRVFDRAPDPGNGQGTADCISFPINASGAEQNFD